MKTQMKEAAGIYITYVTDVTYVTYLHHGEVTRQAALFGRIPPQVLGVEPPDHVLECRELPL